MAEPIGKIEKPPAEPFKEGRKLYLVPVIYFNENDPSEYKEKCNRYWQQVADQISSLEAKIGEVGRVYYEYISLSGEAAMAIVERINPSSYQIAKSKCDKGAVFEAIEERELLEVAMDWERCLLLGFTSEKVASKVSEFYTEASGKRYEVMIKRINETLKDKEAGLLFVSERHRLQFPRDMEVFNIFPPALDEVHCWLRDHAKVEEKETPEAED